MQRQDATKMIKDLQDKATQIQVDLTVAYGETDYRSLDMFSYKKGILKGIAIAQDYAINSINHRDRSGKLEVSGNDDFPKS